METEVIVSGCRSSKRTKSSGARPGMGLWVFRSSTVASRTTSWEVRWRVSMGGSGVVWAWRRAVVRRVRERSVLDGIG